MYYPVLSLIIDDQSDYEISSEYGCPCESCDHTCPCKVRYSGLSESSEVGPIFECNQHCKCCLSCSNKIVQAGSSCKISIKRSGDKGLGVFAEEYIPKGTYIGQYAGRLVEKNTQGKYVFQIRENTPSRVIVTTVDAQYFGNFTRFFNHSCKPNLDVRPVRIDYIVPHIAFFAISDIVSGEELCFKYRESGMNQICLCGSENCNGIF